MTKRKVILECEFEYHRDLGLALIRAGLYLAEHSPETWIEEQESQHKTATVFIKLVEEQSEVKPRKRKVLEPVVGSGR